MLKSNLFNNIEINNETLERLKNDFNILQNHDKVEELSKYVINVISATTKRDVYSLSTEYAKQYNIELNHLENLLNLSVIFIKAFAYNEQNNNSVDDILDDLIELKIVNQINPQIEKYFRLLQIYAEEDVNQKIVVEKTYEKGSSRFLQLATAISFRAIFKNESTFGDLSSDYEPECTGILPIVNLNFSISNSKNEEKKVSFECSEEKLIELLNTIKMTIKELNTSKKFLNFKSENE